MVLYFAIAHFLGDARRCVVRSFAYDGSNKLGIDVCVEALNPYRRRGRMRCTSLSDTRECVT
jgi:hypothetical protein